MAAGMARGWAAARDQDGAGPDLMLFSDSGSGRAAILAEEVGGEAVTANEDLVSRSDVVVLAMKPAGLAGAAASAKGAGTIISVLGATPVDNLTEHFPDSHVFRLMPNLGVQFRRGVLCISLEDSIPPETVSGVRDLLGTLGRVVEMPDEQMDGATAVMGCSPAYFAMVAGAIADAGAADGLDHALSLSMVIESMAGTAELLTSYSPSELRTAVASPGGSTEVGLSTLEEHEVPAAFEAAVEASLKRMRGD